jgi:hypothetical protein
VTTVCAKHSATTVGRENLLAARSVVLAMLLGCQPVGPCGSVSQARAEVPVDRKVEPPSPAFVGIPGTDGDVLDFLEGRYCLKQPARAVRLVGEGNRIAVPLQATNNQVSFPEQLYFEKVVVLKPSGAMVISVGGQWYHLEDRESFQELGELHVEMFQPCATAGAGIEQILHTVQERFHVQVLQHCHWSRSREELPETTCSSVKEVETLGQARFAVSVSGGGRRVASFVVANSAIQHNVLSNQGRVACPPVQSSSTKRALVASMAVLQTAPNSETSIDLWARGCFGVLIGTIDGEGPTAEQLTTLLDNAVARHAKTPDGRPDPRAKRRHQANH